MSTYFGFDADTQSTLIMRFPKERLKNVFLTKEPLVQHNFFVNVKSSFWNQNRGFHQPLWRIIPFSFMPLM